MADVGVVDVAVGQGELTHIADVDVVRIAGAGAVVINLAVLDGDRTRRIRCAEDPILVAVQVHVVEQQRALVVADAGAVTVRHGDA